jgi:NADH-quinone oxidoreductase subunit J
VWFVPVILATILLSGLLSSFPVNSIEVAEVGVMRVSRLLFGPYVLAVELASFLLLAGLISAYHLAKSR